MIVVDSSVWIANLRGIDIAPVDRLRALADDDQIIVGDLILLEVLQGARDDAHAGHMERHLRRFDVVSMLDDALAVRAAGYYRSLRSRGVTPRKTADLIIGTFCIAWDYRLLHADRDFDPMVEYLGLRLA